MRPSGQTRTRHNPQLREARERCERTVTMVVDILKTSKFPNDLEILLDQHFVTHAFPEGAEAMARFLDRHGDRIRGIASSSRGGLVDDTLMARLPKLEVISSYSAGTENIDAEAAARRGVKLVTSSQALADDVADVALALMLCLLRRLGAAERHVREGRWSQGAFELGNCLKAKKVGILGLGTIGREIARRAEAFRMEVGYTGRYPKADSPFRYFDRLADLAGWCDMLVVSCPGGPDTFHLVDAAILKALGPDRFLVNIARGSVVDEVALIAALQALTLKGAGLDVFNNEPAVPAELIASDRVVLLPHIGSGTVETRKAMGVSMVEALKAHLIED
jgi:lactate dehydrogenase-like 2-hydroxyacid dehydrogenase